MIITVAGFKGGVAKTTTAVHLACYFSERSPTSTLLVDGDPNRSSLGWSERGNLPFAVCDLMAATKASRGKEHVIVDTEAHPEQKQLEALAAGCDLMLLPTTPDALAVEALISTVDLLKGLGSYGVVLTRVDVRKKTTANQAREALKKIGIHVFNQQIRQYTAYEKSALLGVPVYHCRDKFKMIAWNDYKALGQEVEAYVEKIEE